VGKALPRRTTKVQHPTNALPSGDSSRFDEFKINVDASADHHLSLKDRLLLQLTIYRNVASASCAGSLRRHLLPKWSRPWFSVRLKHFSENTSQRTFAEMLLVEWASCINLRSWKIQPWVKKFYDFFRNKIFESLDLPNTVTIHGLRKFCAVVITQALSQMKKHSCYSL